MSNQYDLAVQRGMALLDEKRPGWLGHIDLTTLDLREPCRCVLGQEFGHYEDGREATDLDQQSVVALGFDIDASTATSYPSAYYRLTRVWKRAIRARRKTQRAASGEAG